MCQRWGGIFCDTSKQQHSENCSKKVTHAGFLFNTQTRTHTRTHFFFPSFTQVWLFSRALRERLIIVFRVNESPEEPLVHLIPPELPANSEHYTHNRRTTQQQTTMK